MSVQVNDDLYFLIQHSFEHRKLPLSERQIPVTTVHADFMQFNAILLACICNGFCPKSVGNLERCLMPCQTG